MTETQLSLSVGLSRSTDPGTSAQAARTITGRTEKRIIGRFALVDLTQEGAGLTDDDLCRLMPDIFPPTLKSARSRLSNKGLLVDTGLRRPSARGLPMAVWRLA